MAARYDLRADAPWRAIVEDMTECIVRWLPDGTRVFVNDAYCRLFDAPREALLGTSFWPLVDPADRDFVQARLARATPEDPVITGVHRAIGPGGRLIWMEWTDRAIFGPRGAITEYQSVGRDITEQVRLQEVARSVARADGIAQASAAIAHDLANVFMVVSMMVDTPLDEIDAADMRDARAMVTHGRELLDQLRDLRFGRVVAPERLDLAAQLRRNEPLLRSLVRCRLALVAEAPCLVMGDPTQLDQVVFNLIRNADQAAGGAGEIRVEVRELSQEAVRLTVADTAGGIPAAVLPHIFKPRFTTRAEGQGLGLATVHTLVKGHGGDIVVDTDARGTTFSITLPRAPREAAAG